MHELVVDTSKQPDRQKWITFCKQLAQQDDFQDDWHWLDAWLALNHGARLHGHAHPIRIQFDHIEHLTAFVLQWS